MKIKEKFYPTKKNDLADKVHFFRAMDRYKKCTNKKNLSQMKREIQVCQNYWKCYPYHYFIYDLFRADNEITDDELINYIPHFYFSYLFLPYWTSQKFSMIAVNKIITEQFFNALKISQPKTACILMSEKLYSSGMVRLSYDQIMNELQSENPHKLFVKPAEGWGGIGIYIFNKSNEGLYVTSDNIKFNENFLEEIGKNNDYIIQIGVIQDPEISKIYPDSVNTCRIITENKNGVVRVVCAMLRIGRGQKEIDNITSGGICVNIDIDNGKFGDFAISYEGEKFIQHPDSQFIFHSEKITRWDEIRKFTLESSGKIPFLTYLGWDIALTTEGPVCIEINSGPALDIMEMTSCGLREAFGIEDPDFYWKNRGKRI